MTNGYDQYKEARDIADEIERAGHPSEAEQIRDAIDNGRSGTEIFMQLRFYLQPFQHSTQLDGVTLDRLGVLLANINSALSR
jgi:hypothetical protein